MAIEELEFTKNWENKDDFPTYEDTETQVRADIQLLYDEIKDFINTKLVGAFNSTSGAENIITSSGQSVEFVLQQLQEAINNLGGGGSGGGSVSGSTLYVFYDGKGNVTLGGIQDGGTT